MSIEAKILLLLLAGTLALSGALSVSLRLDALEYPHECRSSGRTQLIGDFLLIGCVLTFVAFVWWVVVS
jgi:hypothetical protein